MSGHVYLLATLDTKGPEALFLRELLAGWGVSVRLVDVGCLGRPGLEADITREDVFSAGGASLAECIRNNDRGEAVAAAARGAAASIAAKHVLGEVAGVLSLGGSAGTTIGTAAMRVLPLGVPKLMVSTLASGEVQHYVGGRDILMLNSVVDIAGINRISRQVLSNAAAAMAGMLRERPPSDHPPDRRLIAASMFGVTTPCVQHARSVLEAAGYEVLVFHATGSGGKTMESLIAEGWIDGVLDITTTELADELVGGVLSAGPDRLNAAAQHGIPQVVSVGATDMVNFHARHTVPAQFAGRKFHQHNDNVTLMRTTPEENEALGKMIGTRLANARGPVTVLLPGQGVSAIDVAGGPFDDPQARQTLFLSLRKHAGRVRIEELDLHINDPQFAAAAAKELLRLMHVSIPTRGGSPSAL